MAYTENCLLPIISHYKNLQGRINVSKHFLITLFNRMTLPTRKVFFLQGKILMSTFPNLAEAPSCFVPKPIFFFCPLEDTLYYMCHVCI